MQSWVWLCVVVTLVSARELDPSACASRFDVQKDKIIKTEESRDMGARYISELDVGTRQECLRLCCETDTCDVFVYEERTPGSCYLFACGPPEDFRCKFTTHGNFSSGVLALSRRLAELQDQERLLQRERELSNLRVVASTTAAVQTTTMSTTPSTTTRPTPSQGLPATTAHRCSRYQFECHSGGECIAVYNACDGIPQCADGSDEAPELGCPSAPPVDPAPPAAMRPPPAPLKTKQHESAESSSGEGLAAGAGAAAGGEVPVLGDDHWPHRLTQAQPHRYNSESVPSSHIFSHKGGLLQEPENNVMSGNMMGQYPGYESTWPRRPWPQPPPGMEGIGWSGGVNSGAGGYPHYEWNEPDPRRAWPVPQPRPDPIADLPVYVAQKTMPETPIIYSSQQHTLRDSPKKGYDLKQSAEADIQHTVVPTAAASGSNNHKAVEDTKPESTTKKKELKHEAPVTKKPAAPTAAVVKAEAVVTHDHFTSMDDHDGLSEHPPSAVMLLILGILMTTVMGTMLACRIRVARRRMRRGKSPFAHDADYLVNGMYL